MRRIYLKLIRKKINESGEEAWTPSGKQSRCSGWHRLDGVYRLVIKKADFKEIHTPVDQPKKP